MQRTIEELRQTETQLDDVQGEIQAAQDVVERVEVRAPVSGVVVRLNFHTAGGVIAPGATILELLPLKDELQIEARLNPADISYVHSGQSALARLTALNKRVTPMIAAKVVYLSANSVETQQVSIDKAAAGMEKRGDSYIVRIKLEEEDVRKRIQGFRPTPGMPADVYIKTGERSFVEYIMRPVMDTFARSFREH